MQMRTLWAAWLAAGLVAGLWALPAAADGDAREFEIVNGQWAPVAQPEAGTPEGELARLRKHVAEGNGRRACWVADDFLDDYPTAPQREEVLHLWGQAEMLRGRYFQAYERFEQQLLEHPTGQYAQRALEREYEIGDAFLNGRKRTVLGFVPLPAEGDGMDILKRIPDHAPGSLVAERALMRLADYHYDDQKYANAAQAYDRYLESFARSERAPYAQLQAARATYASFHGVSYENTPLLDARQRFRVFREQYPAEAERANVDGILERIHQALAEQQFRTGEFYERIERPTSAGLYYRTVVSEYAGTPWAQRAQQALDRLGVPAAPPAPRSVLETVPPGPPDDADQTLIEGQTP